MRFSKVIEEILINSSLGFVAANNLFIGDIPTTPDNIIVVFDTSPYSMSERNYDYEYLTFQIFIRNKTYPTGYDLCDSIVNELDKKVQYEFQDTEKNINYNVVSIQKFSGPIPLGKDNNQRHQFSINFRVQIQPIG
jgi:hypothetical protein